jgi:broad specificity phosphatase PhoE
MTLDARAWADAAQDRRDDEARGHSESAADHAHRYAETLDRVARQSPADSTTAQLHAETRRQLRTGGPTRG